METIVNPQYKREDIIQRIVFTIAKKWQINEKEVASRFDPLMMLLVEVIAQEMDIINTQWKISVEEMTETIIQRFFPKFPIKEHLPHIAILQAKPLEPSAILPSFFDFKFQHSDHNFHFTPIQETKLFDISQHSLWINDNPFVQSASFQSKAGNVVRSIGLLCKRASTLETLDGLQMYIDTGSQSERSLLLYAIQHGKCTINGEEVALQIGCKSSAAGHDGFWAVLQELSFALYNSNFVTITQQNSIPALNTQEDIWQKLDDKAKKELDPQTLVYIRWDLPVQLQERWLNQFSIRLNAFVGLNRSQANIQHKLDPYVNVIPLAIDQHLLMVEQVKGDNNELYKFVLSATDDSLQDGQYLLKTTNFGKMSSDALRYSIQDLKDQVNSSNAFFADVSNDYIGRHLQDMQRIVYRLEDKMSNAVSLKQQMQYLIIKPNRADKFVSVDYWTFDNRYLEKLRPDTILDTKGSLIEKSSAILISKPYPLSTSYKNNFNNQLQQIVSQHDIETLARNVFGMHLDKVDIQRVYQSTNNVYQNKHLTLSINIQVKAGYDLDFAILDQNRIQYEMEKNSLLSYPFSVNIIHL